MEVGDCPLVSAEPKVDLGTIFRDLGEGFLERERLNPNQKRVFRRVGECRTAAMGGAVWQCQACGRKVGVYHSCRDRHCPKCQAMHRYRWAEDRHGELLPVPYFHVVFTLPHELNWLVAANPLACLGLLFQCASKTLLAFASDPKFLGAEPGILMVLHTWGQKLNLHYHVHCMVTCGGLVSSQSRWVSATDPKFLFPVRALAKVFRGKYLSGLDTLWQNGLVDPAGLSMQSPHDWLAFKHKLAKKKQWNVYSQEPYGNSQQLIKYLAQYTNRAAISNDRILSYDGKQVCFRYKKYQKNAFSFRTLTLNSREFARRFLLHVLPSGFMRIRYYGFLANCKKKKSLQMARKILTILRLIPTTSSQIQLDSEKIAQEDQQETNPSNQLEFQKCPFCQASEMRPSFLYHEDRQRARSLLWDTS